MCDSNRSSRTVLLMVVVLFVGLFSLTPDGTCREQPQQRVHHCAAVGVGGQHRLLAQQSDELGARGLASCGSQISCVEGRKKVIE